MKKLAQFIAAALIALGFAVWGCVSGIRGAQ